MEEKNIILVNTDYISGKEIETIRLVNGCTVQTRHLDKNIAQGIKSLIGGELKVYNEMMNNARELATERMINEAKKIGADGIVNVRYATSEIMQYATEVIVYGTAVKFK